MRKWIASKVLLLIILSLFSNEVGAQKEDYISGKTVDFETGNPIAFVTIRLLKTNSGLISNADGGFKIPYDVKNRIDSISFTSIGYEKKNIALANLKIGELNLVKLVPAVEDLGEIRIISAKTKDREELNLSASEIIAKAIKRIPNNYPNQPFSCVGYYRDYQMRNDSYLNLNEALLKVYDQGFYARDLPTTKTVIYQLKQNTDFERNRDAERKYDYFTQRKIVDNDIKIGELDINEFYLLRVHDPIRNHRTNSFDFINRLDTDFLRNHSFTLGRETTNGSSLLYQINIYRNINGIIVRGKIYIEKENFAIHKIEYTVLRASNEESQKHNSYGSPSLSDAGRDEEETSIYSLTEEYQKINTKMYPSYISFNNVFKLQATPKFRPIEMRVFTKDQYFSLVFNNNIDETDADRINNYRLTVNDKRIRLDKVRIERNIAHLYPKNPDELFKEYADYFENITENNFVDIGVKNIEDVFGNRVNESNTQFYNQYREFFIQEITDYSLPPQDYVMDPSKPIFGNQPINSGDNLSGYWMNTPLKQNYISNEN
ncbi:carboxypeptidase-like regulatory domain-containing protein [Leeuwenhoekiella parthenopeia]|uniref:Carboxypeptidase-like regulatory domain-containing protein n=1 Tax=Leeuwenhoekiella parthenopeia TaxID=2890320 RepID=A0ABS8GVH8_9FLAO|nr:carboxypeptidase-like regulatory domain-containing protein [Leeuwenhoekiella parthenopeia]MCC4213670.1 carboxypeptidase-like regulatory domain-containing protein [Leeuwenhoekiella parthenopeia]